MLVVMIDNSWPGKPCGDQEKGKERQYSWNGKVAVYGDEALTVEIVFDRGYFRFYLRAELGDFQAAAIKGFQDLAFCLM
jgi:hypothetical protein